MPRKSTWSYAKKRRKKKEKIFMDDNNIDEETVTDSFVMKESLDSNSHSSSFLELHNSSSFNYVKSEPESEDQNCQAAATTSSNAKNLAFTDLFSQTNVKAEESVKSNEMSLDKYDGNKFLSLLQISNDDNEDKMNLLCTNSDIENKDHKKVLLPKNLTELNPSASKTGHISMMKNNSLSVVNKEKTVTLEGINNDKQPNNLIFPHAGIKQEPADDFNGDNCFQENLTELNANSKAGRNTPTLSDELSISKTSELLKRSKVEQQVNKLCSNANIAKICIKLETVDATDVSRSEHSSLETCRSSCMTSESKGIKKETVSPKSIELINEMNCDQVYKKNTPEEQPSNFNKNVVAVNIKQEPLESLVSPVPEIKLISDIPSVKQSSNNSVQSIDPKLCQTRVDVHMNDCENRIKIAEAYLSCEIAKNIKKEVLDSSLPPNNVGNSTARQSRYHEDLCKIKPPESVINKDNVSVSEMSLIFKSGTSIDHTKHNVKKELDNSTQISENMIQNNCTNLNQLNISQQQMPHTANKLNTKPVLEGNTKISLEKALIECIQRDAIHNIEHINISCQNNSNGNEIKGNDPLNNNDKLKSISSVEKLPLTNNKFIKEELVSDCTIGIQENLPSRISKQYSSFNSDSLQQSYLSKHLKVSTRQQVSEQKDAINEITKSVQRGKDKMPQQITNVNLKNAPKLDAVCIVDVDTDKIISVIPSKHTESTNSIVITISDDETDFIPSEENKTSIVNESKSITQAFSNMECTTRSHFEAQSLCKIEAEFTKSEFTSSSNIIVQNTDFHTGNSNFNPNRFTKFFNVNTVNDHNLLLHESQHELFKSFHFSNNDENDIVKLDIFPVSEEEVSAYSNIIKEFHNIKQHSKKLVIDYDYLENDILNLFKEDLYEKEYFNNTLENIAESSRYSPSIIKANYNQRQSLSDLKTGLPLTLSSDVFIGNDAPVAIIPSKEMLHDIVMNLHSFRNTSVSPCLTTNATFPLSQTSDVNVNNIEVLRVPDLHSHNQHAAEFDPDAKKLLNISSEELRNILVKTKNKFCHSPQSVLSSMENFVDTSDCFPSSEVVLHGEIETNPSKTLDKNPETNSFVHDTLNNIPSKDNDSASQLSSMEAKQDECKNFNKPITTIIMEKVDGLSHKSSLENDNMICIQEQPMTDKTNKCSTPKDKKKSSSSNDNISNEALSCDSDSTMPYEDMELSDEDASPKSHTNESDKEDTKVPKYTSKLEKIIEKQKSLIALNEQKVQIKKAITISDPKLAKFCEKQREKKKAVIPVINPLPLESEKISVKNKGIKQSSSENYKSTKKPDCKNSKKGVALKKATKDEKTTKRKKSLSSKVLVDDASNLFMPDCKIVQKPKKKPHGKKRPLENDVINASVVSYGNRTINRGSFLTQTPSEEPPQKSRRKVNLPLNIPKQNITTETMHIMAESPQIKVFYPDNNLTHKLPLATQSMEKSNTGKTNQFKASEPSKINLEEYTKRQKNWSSPNRDFRFGFSKITSQQSATLLSGTDNKDRWSPASSNSSFTSFENQTNSFERFPQSNTNINQNYSMGSYVASSSVSSPLNAPYFNAEPLQQESLNFPSQHQFPLPPPPNLPSCFISPVVQLNKSISDFGIKMPETPLLDGVSSFLKTMPTKVPQHFGVVPPKYKRCSSLVPKTLKARIGHKLIKTEHMTLLVLEWSVDWLIQQHKNQSPPPITNGCSPLKQVMNSYKTFEDHYNTYLPLLLFELWQRIFHAWTYITNFVLNCDIDSFNSVTDFSIVEFVTYVKDLDVEEKKYPEEGSVVIMRFVSANGSGIKMLGFIKSASLNNNNWNSDPKYERYGSYSNEHNLMLRFTAICAYNAADINLNEKVRIQILCNIKTHLKQNDALINVNESHLKEIILKPEGESVFSVALGTRQSHMDVTVLQTVKDIAEGVRLPHLVPQLTIVKALPSSDRITTLVCLVEEIKKLQHKVLLCTRTKVAFKEIGFNLENSQLDMVILGTKADVHRKLRKYMLDERASLLIKEHSLSKHSKTTKESVLRAKKVIIKKCDIMLSLIQNCHNDAVAETVNEDFHISLSCIIDEANLCTEPESLIPLLYGITKLILVGDPSDPAKVCSKTAIENNYNRSLFERAYSLNVEDAS